MKDKKVIVWQQTTRTYSLIINTNKGFYFLLVTLKKNNIFFHNFFFHRLHRDGVIKSVKYTWCALFINTVFILKCSHICANKKIWTNIKINEQNFGHAMHSLSSSLFQV